MPESKKDLMIRRTDEYLALHASDPKAYPATIKDVAAFVPVARRLFYKTDPEIQGLVSRIETAAKSQAEKAPELRLSAEDASLSDLASRDLEEEIEQTVRRATWALQRWLGIAKRSTGPSDAAMVSAYLDEALRQARRAHADLASLVAEYQRRQSSRPDPEEQDGKD